MMYFDCWPESIQAVQNTITNCENIIYPAMSLYVNLRLRSRDRVILTLSTHLENFAFRLCV